MKRTLNNGFTLTELMLAMAFLAFVLLFIVTAMVQYLSLYNKGVVYKEINQAGRTAFEEITRNVRINSATLTQVSKGRLCAGGQAYIWNKDGSDTNKYTDNTRVAGLIRVPDANYCSADLPLILKDNQTVIAGSNIQVLLFSGKQADKGGLYELTLTLATTGENAPIADTNECEPGKAGEFCAVAIFTTTVATRK